MTKSGKYLIGGGVLAAALVALLWWRRRQKQDRTLVEGEMVVDEGGNVTGTVETPGGSLGFSGSGDSSGGSGFGTYTPSKPSILSGNNDSDMDAGPTTVTGGVSWIPGGSLPQPQPPSTSGASTAQVNAQVSVHGWAVPGGSPSKPVSYSDITPGFSGYTVGQSGKYLSHYAKRAGLGGNAWRAIRDDKNNVWLKRLASASVQKSAGFDLRAIYGHDPKSDCVVPGYKASKYRRNTGQYPVFYIPRG